MKADGLADPYTLIFSHPSPLRAFDCNNNFLTARTSVSKDRRSGHTGGGKNWHYCPAVIVVASVKPVVQYADWRQLQLLAPVVNDGSSPISRITLRRDLIMP